MRKILFLLIGLVVLLLLYLFLWPVPIEPVAWTPPEQPGLTGSYAENNYLLDAQLYPLDSRHGPEDTVLGPDGLIYTGLADGSIVRFSPDNGSTLETIVNTGGRSLGMKFDDERLYIADCMMGLLYIDNATAESGHRVEVAVDQFEGVKMIFVDDLVVASDGIVWFTDASTRFDLENNITDFFESNPSGRLFAWDPESGRTSLHVDGLGFANGVAFGPDEAYLLINETMRYRIKRYWLVGEKKGQTDIFIDNLPGFPDNLSNNDEGLFWVALIYPRAELVDSILPWPFLRKVILRLPEAMRVSEPDPMGLVIALDYEGNVIHNLQDHTGHCHTITSVKEEDGYLWLGSLHEPHVARIRVPE